MSTEPKCECAILNRGTFVEIMPPKLDSNKIVTKNDRVAFETIAEICKDRLENSQVLPSTSTR